MTGTQLLGCWHCAGHPVERSTFLGDEPKYRVICESCGCGTPWCSTSERAWRLWNARVHVRGGQI